MTATDLTASPKKVLLLAPTMSRDSSTTKWLSPNIGIYRINGFLAKHGHMVECYDHGLYMAGGTPETIEEVLTKHEWDYIGFSVLEESIPDDLSNMHLAAKLCPTATLVAGGIEAQYNYQTIMDKSPCRICVLGEGERPMLEIVNGKPLHEIAGVVFKNLAHVQTDEEFWEVSEAVKYEDVPYEKYWSLYESLYDENLSNENQQKIHTVRIFTRNYCPVGCKFCVSTNQLSDAAGVKRAKVVDIIDDRLIHLIRRVIDSHPTTKTIYFTDDDFCANLNKVKDFCRLAIKENFGVSFICFGRVSKFDEEAIELMAMAGFRIVNMGLESLSQRVLDEYGKRSLVSRMEENLKLFVKHGITPFTSVILCSPEGRLEEVEETASKMIELLKDGRQEAGINISVQPYRGSSYHDEYHDFEVELIPVPGTKYKVRKEYFIRCQDPEVRELQYRFLEHYPELIKREHDQKGLKHATSSAQAVLKLELLLELIEQIKLERSDKEKWAEKERALVLVDRGIRAINSLKKYSSGSAL